MLQLLHESHPGIFRMNATVRSVVWWPGIDKHLKHLVKSCPQCQQTQNTLDPLQPWEWPEQPWSRLHIDHTSLFIGKYFLVVEYAHSKCMEVEIVPSTATAPTVQKLRNILATQGLPETIVSDNGICFTSSEFQEFITRNGICHS